MLIFAVARSGKPAASFPVVKDYLFVKNSRAYA